MHTEFVDQRPACRLTAVSRGNFKIEWRNHSIDHSDATRGIDKAAVKNRFLALLGGS